MIILFIPYSKGLISEKLKLFHWSTLTKFRIEKTVFISPNNLEPPIHHYRVLILCHVHWLGIENKCNTLIIFLGLFTIFHPLKRLIFEKLGNT